MPRDAAEEMIHMKGGHANSGPAPDPNALRGDRDRGGWTTLPADGRAGDPPTWPLKGFSAREKELWIYLWSKPQATQWERLGLEMEVALHCRSFVVAEALNAPVAARTLVRQQMEQLGLTLPGMRMLRWKLAEVAKDKQADGPVATVTPIGRSPRDRLTVVSGDGKV
jgi:hypothetical protein